MSPEQLRGAGSDARSDLFSFGVVLYEMLSGHRAFRGKATADTISAVLREDPPELTASGRDVPPILERIVRHCLEKDPAARFQSAATSLSIWRRYPRSRPPRLQPLSEPRRRTGLGSFPACWEQPPSCCWLQAC
jgi:serine/threonine protein kinase